jgi:alpha-1,2-mannosyltransferase
VTADGPLDYSGPVEYSDPFVALVRRARRRVVHPPTWVLAVVALVVFAAGARWGIHIANFRHRWDFLDFNVYRAGAEAVLNRTPLYSAHPPGSDLLFTYPPFAALVFVPLELSAVTVARAAVTVVSLGSAFVLAYACLRGAGRRPGWRTGWWALALAGVTLRAWPMDQTFQLGQVDLLVVAMVVGDLVLVSSRNRGWLLGVAAGFKPTPLVLVAFLVLSRQWRAAGQAVVGFALTVAAGFAVLPGTSRLYWRTEVFDVARIGSLGYLANQSLTGLATRSAGHIPSSQTRLVLALVVGVPAAVLVVAWLSRPGPARRFEAMCLLAVAGLLASPVSWTHHWVWWLPVLVALGGRAGAARSSWSRAGWTVAAVIWSVIFWFPPAGVHDPAGTTHPWWFTLGGDGYLSAGIALLVGAALYLLLPAVVPVLRPWLTPVPRGHHAVEQQIEKPAPKEEQA